jgi:hypothetical protein
MGIVNKHPVIHEARLKLSYGFSSATATTTERRRIIIPALLIYRPSYPLLQLSAS